MAHGTRDDIIPLARARRARDVLLGLGYGVQWHEYPMPHSVSDTEVADLSRWLRTVLDKERS
jgi:phospholipase/carboxylesterase